ncbi:MAG: sigma-54-dependent Fis family transcriptional regulator [Deltaproteobacteria bacterium]|nr:sigma-54-dependent Fis family transcriptional regulator [Deltaproteobacteria bacterium]
MEPLKILVVDDEAPLREILQRSLAKMGGFSVEVAINGQEAIEKVEKDIFDLILTDLMMPEMDGMEFLKMIKATRPEIPVIMMTAYGSIDTAVEAMKIGASDYITKPVDLKDLLLRITKVHQESRLLRDNRLLGMELRKKFEFSNIIGKSRKMQEVFSLIEKVAPSNSTVIIYGSSGTGKELVAKAIHYNSPRADRPFIPFNCSAIPETLVESELFGHTRGAFTGAVQAKRGLFEEAHESTLFLDEISTILPSVQVKLLRVLQEKEVAKVGSTERTKIDVRMIAATNEDLETNMKDGRFRDDLFYRLHVFPIFLPDLKERREDIPLLAYHFLDLYSKEARKEVKGISKEAMNLLLEYHWPGNVRELENTIERAVIMAEEEFLTPQDLPGDLAEGFSFLIRRGVKGHKSLDEIKAEYITQILKQTNGNKNMAAEILKVNPRTLYRFEKKGASGDSA